MSRYLVFTLNDTSPYTFVDSGHDLAFGLVKVTAENLIRFQHLQENAKLFIKNFNMSEVRFYDNNILFIDRKQEDGYLDMLVDHIYEISSSYQGEVIAVELDDDIVDALEDTWADVCEFRYMDFVKASYVALFGDYIELETMGDDYADIMARAMLGDTVLHDVAKEVQDLEGVTDDELLH